MKLHEYFFFTRTPQSEFAKSLGIAPSHLSQIINYKRKVGAALAKKISQKTNGFVSIEEILYPEDHPDLTLEEISEYAKQKRKNMEQEK